MNAPAQNLPFHSIADLVTALRAGVKYSPPEFVRECLARLEVNLSELEPYVRFDTKLYGRVPICVEQDFALFLMTWLPGQLTPIHDHRGSACAVRVIRGLASEITFKRAACGTLVPHAVARAAPGTVLLSYDGDTHQLGNLEAVGEVVCLHCYSPPLAQMQWFSLSETCFAGHDQILTGAKART